MKERPHHVQGGTIIDAIFEKLQASDGADCQGKQYEFGPGTHMVDGEN